MAILTRACTLCLGVNVARELRVGGLDGADLDICLRAVVRRVVAEDGSTVEWRVGLREVEPALVTDAGRKGTTNSNTNDVSA